MIRRRTFVCEVVPQRRGFDKWLRRRLRFVQWKQWRRGRTRLAELRQRGIEFQLAAKTAGSAHSPWRFMNSPALSFALPHEYFDSLGLPYFGPLVRLNPTNRRMRTRLCGAATGARG
jgi:RNA-directed DNA polymerase